MYAYSLSRDTPISGKLADPFTGFSTYISTPFLWNFSQLSPLSREHYRDPYSIFVYFFSFLFFGLGKYVYVFHHYKRGGGGLPHIYNIIRALYSLFSGGYWRLGIPVGKHARINYTPPPFLNFKGSFWKISHREIDLKTPLKWIFLGFLGKIFPRQTAK